MKKQQTPPSGPISEQNLLNEVHAAPLLRRIGAILYDSLMVFSVVFISVQWLLLVPEASRDSLMVIICIRITVVCASFAFLGWFWTHSGQTIGMKTWRLRIVTEDGQSITWAQALMRYIVALISWAAIGLGFFWAILDRDKRTWHDIASNTRLVVLPKN